MEYVEKLQRRQTLAKSLVENGLAANIQEAMKQIEDSNEFTDIQNDDGSQLGSPLPEIKEQETKVVEPKDKEQTTITETPNNDEHIKKLTKIENFLKRFDTFFSKFHEESLSKFNNLNKEINSLKSEIEELKKNKSSVILTKKEDTEAEAQTEFKHNDIESTKNNYHPRRGTYTSADVAIDVIFSNSNGRMTKK